MLLRSGGEASGISLERWLQRRMLRHGACHFCCADAPEAGCSHPEPAFAQLELCGDCHGALEGDQWKT